MAVDHIRYDLLTQNALREVVRKVLADTAKKGLTGEHHFYITFDTRADGVTLSARLREQYPRKMTIILQHQFWDLKVRDDAFEVGLSFGGVAERLTVPFAAIKGFFDPSVQFGLQFGSDDEEEDDTAQAPAAQERPEEARDGETAPPAAPAAEKAPPALPAAAPKRAPKAVNAEAGKPETDGPDKPAGGAEVVRLDRFRKK
jgi:hypothetical protein